MEELRLEKYGCCRLVVVAVAGVRPAADGEGVRPDCAETYGPSRGRTGGGERGKRGERSGWLAVSEGAGDSEASEADVGGDAGCVLDTDRASASSDAFRS